MNEKTSLYYYSKDEEYTQLVSLLFSPSNQNIFLLMFICGFCFQNTNWDREAINSDVHFITINSKVSLINSRQQIAILLLDNKSK